MYTIHVAFFIVHFKLCSLLKRMSIHEPHSNLWKEKNEKKFWYTVISLLSKMQRVVTHYWLTFQQACYWTLQWNHQRWHGHLACHFSLLSFQQQIPLICIYTLQKRFEKKTMKSACIHRGLQSKMLEFKGLQ